PVEQPPPARGVREPLGPHRARRGARRHRAARLRAGLTPRRPPREAAGATRPMGSSLIRGRYVITGAASGVASVIEDGAVLERDGTIVEVGPAASLAHHAVDRTLGSPGHVVLPGFVNGHHHVGLTPFQLGSPDLPLELWFVSRMAARDVDPYQSSSGRSGEPS